MPHRACPTTPGAAVHPVAAVDLPGLKPAPLDGVAEPIFDRIAPGDLLVDESYQRGLSRSSLRLIRSIVEGWDWLKFKPPVVAITDRGFEVIDGQHTAIASACHPDIETIPILAVDGSDHARRARAFVSHAVDRLQATPMQVWHAAVAAGDEDATTIRNVLDRAGIKLLTYPPTDGVYGVNDTLALGAVRRLVDKRGAMWAREVLEIVAAAGLSPVIADHVRIAEALLLDPDYAGQSPLRGSRWRCGISRPSRSSRRRRSPSQSACRHGAASPPSCTGRTRYRSGGGRRRPRRCESCRAADRGGVDRFLLDRLCLDGEAPLRCEVDRMMGALDRLARLTA